MVRTLVEDYLGWKVCGEAENGWEAVQKTEELDPDLIILDLAMPVVDGLEAARSIGRLRPGLPIVLHTRYLETLVEVEAKAAGVLEVISKGGSPESFVGKLRYIEEQFFGRNPGRH